MKNALVIGGTGIIGVPLVMELIRHGEYKVQTISLEPASNHPLPPSVTQHLIDRNSDRFADFVHSLNSSLDVWDAVIDLIAFNEKSARQTHDLFKDNAMHIITVSTTLVYDRTEPSREPITEDTPLSEAGILGGYVDGKLGIERFWTTTNDVHWTVVRPYHILGSHSLLGCVPEHNRDPHLLDEIREGMHLKLCEGGNIPFNYIHPKDIATAIARISGNKKTFGQTYNVVNPKPVLAIEYYEEIARQLGRKLFIENVTMDTIWKEGKGWEMTTLPHIYSVEKLRRDTGYVPETPLTEGIADAIKTYPKIHIEADQIPIHQRMNKLPKPTRMSWL